MLPGQSQLQVRVTGAEKRGFKRAAMHVGLNLSDWARSILRTEAQRILGLYGERAPFAGVPRRGKVEGSPPADTRPVLDVNNISAQIKERIIDSAEIIENEILYETARPGAGKIDSRETMIGREMTSRTGAGLTTTGVGPSEFASQGLHDIHDAVQERYQKTMPESLKGPPLAPEAPSTVASEKPPYADEE